MDIVPALLIVRPGKAIVELNQLSRYPNTQFLSIDHLLSDMIDALEKPHLLTGRQMEDAVNWLVRGHDLASLHYEEEECELFKNTIRACFIHLRDEFERLMPYHDGRLAYRFKERRGKDSVLLQRKNTIVTFAPAARVCHYPY